MTKSNECVQAQSSRRELARRNMSIINERDRLHTDAER